MTRTVILSVFMLLIMTVSPLTVTAAESKTITLDIPGMTCKFCPITIKKALKKVPGVINAQADYDTKTATVTFDPDKTNTTALIEATTNAGYPSSLKK